MLFKKVEIGLEERIGTLQYKEELEKIEAYLSRVGQYARDFVGVDTPKFKIRPLPANSDIDGKFVEPDTLYLKIGHPLKREICNLAHETGEYIMNNF